MRTTLVSFIFVEKIQRNTLVSDRETKRGKVKKVGDKDKISKTEGKQKPHSE